MRNYFVRRSLRVQFCLFLLCAGGALAGAAPRAAPRVSCDSLGTAVSHAPGRVVILPGIGNVAFPFAGLAKRLRAQLPEFQVEIRRWGPRLRLLHNLSAVKNNRAAARKLAADLTKWRSAHPDDPLYLVGYSGGGGIAVLSIADLPRGVRVDRLVLVAAAISPGFPLAERVLPHVTEFVADYSSERDWEVDWGTRTFGTIDRVKTASAGAAGFDLRDGRLLEYHWSRADLAFHHHGHHLSYLRPRWEEARLLPVFDPASTSQDVERAWKGVCQDGASQLASAEESSIKEEAP